MNCGRIEYAIVLAVCSTPETHQSDCLLLTTTVSHQMIVSLARICCFLSKTSQIRQRRIIIWAIATTTMFGTLAVGTVSLIIIIAIVIRTHLEDEMLKAELDGYLDYSKTVRFRLFPFI